jgi:methyltransferase-like protein/trans-aconitate methyltransferase
MCAHVAASPSDVLLASYDAVPYGGGAIAFTRPDYLAAAAKLRGLETPDARRCRVLDLGCATGGNLLSMALTFPESSFVGVDLSPRQIAAARNAAETIGVDNVRFEAMSIADVDDSLSTFDYIISHGVYSWVPADVQTALLAVCSNNLSANGIAYVSYNTYPGWHVRGLVRDMILFHDKPELSPGERVKRARALLELMTRSVPDTDTVYAAVLHEELEVLSSASETYFLHEELESENHPVYFIEFARRAAAAGLQYVAEASPSLIDRKIANELRETVRGWAANDVEYEQYLDYARNRTFRRSLFCRAGRAMNREMSPESVPSMYLRARCEADASAPDAQQPGVEVFRTPDGLAVTMSHPLVRAGLHVLIDARPAALSFPLLVERTRARDEVQGTDVSAEVLADAMLRCATVRLLDLTTHPEACSTSLSERPVASPLARLEARTVSVVTSLLHVELTISDLDKYVLLLLDGTHDKRAIVDQVVEALGRGELDLGAVPPREEVVKLVELALSQFRRAGFLVA